MRKAFFIFVISASVLIFFRMDTVLATTVFTDTFTETGVADVNLVSHTPDAGTSWTEVIDNDGSNDAVVSWINDNLNDGTCGANEGIGYIANATYDSTDYYVELTNSTGEAGDDWLWIGVRVDSSGFGYWAQFTADATQIYKNESVGGWQAIGTAGAGIAGGSVVKFEAVGSTITLYDDGVANKSVSDADITSANQAAIGFGDLTNNGTDDCGSGVYDSLSVVTSPAAATSPFPLTPQVF